MTLLISLIVFVIIFTKWNASNETRLTNPHPPWSRTPEVGVQNRLPKKKKKKREREKKKDLSLYNLSQVCLTHVFISGYANKLVTISFPLHTKTKLQYEGSVFLFSFLSFNRVHLFAHMRQKHTFSNTLLWLSWPGLHTCHKTSIYTTWL